MIKRLFLGTLCAALFYCPAASILAQPPEQHLGDTSAEAAAIAVEWQVLLKQVGAQEIHDPSAAIVRYSKFFEQRGHGSGQVSIELSSRIAQLYYQMLGNRDKALEIYAWAVQQYGKLPGSERLRREQELIRAGRKAEIAQLHPKLPTPFTVPLPQAGSSTHTGKALIASAPAASPANARITKSPNVPLDVVPSPLAPQVPTAPLSPVSERIGELIVPTPDVKEPSTRLPTTQFRTTKLPPTQGPVEHPFTVPSATIPSVRIPSVTWPAAKSNVSVAVPQQVTPIVPVLQPSVPELVTPTLHNPVNAAPSLDAPDVAARTLTRPNIEVLESDIPELRQADITAPDLALPEIAATADSSLKNANPPSQRTVDAAQAFGAVVIEAEDFLPSNGSGGWKIVLNGHGNYMVDANGFNHISGERLLCAAAGEKDARAVKVVTLPKAGNYRIWSRFEQPTGVENRFRVEIRQRGELRGAAVMGEKDTPKYFFGRTVAVAQGDATNGSEGLVEQAFDVKGLEAGEAELTLIAVAQPEPAANRNVDFLFLTQDMENTWQNSPNNRLYPILDAALQAIPPRYYLRLTSATTQTISVRHQWNRIPWSKPETVMRVSARLPSPWVPLRNQDVCHLDTIIIRGSSGPSLSVRVEIASAPDATALLRTIEWSDPEAMELLVSLPPYPAKKEGERIETVEEQYRRVLQYLQEHPSRVGRDPKVALNWATGIPVWRRGRIADSAAELYYNIGMRQFVGALSPTDPRGNAMKVEVARTRFKEWGLDPNQSVAINKFRQMPTRENIELAKKTAEAASVVGQVRLFDYGDEYWYSEWLQAQQPQSLKELFAAWQQKRRGKVEFTVPDSSAATAEKDPELYVESLKFYQETAIEQFATMAKQIAPALGPDVLYGPNLTSHPWYYPHTGRFINWFRGGASNFGRHSEFFWQVHQLGPLVNGYIAEHFHSGMRDNPRAVNQQYTMPHSPGNSDLSFRRSCFTHLAHGARGLDFFGIGLNHSFTENYISIRDPGRYAAIRDINRAMATIEDILPQSRPVPSKIALIVSETTERWDYAGVARDRAAVDFFRGYKRARLAYHQERVGLYYALVHHSRPPDLLLEEDVQKGRLKEYQVAYWVGDCAASATVDALKTWVEAGGHLVATGGAFRFDEYRRPLASGLELLGLKEARLEEKDRFFRPQIELPRLQPLDWLGEMPALAIRDEVSAMDEETVAARFKGGQPAVVECRRGKGTTTYIATLPGIAYMWSAEQPAPVPSRGPASHQEYSSFNRMAGQWITKAAKRSPTSLEAHGSKIDARLLESPTGFAIPIANYEPNVLAPVTLTLYGIKNVRRIVSASAGELAFKQEEDGGVTLRYSPGVGDILRVEG